ncbi:Biopolymer transport protein ExbB [Saliniradius amylolyticus]|uniref:Biopolymer transport protein ExbB n=1 Tax=Saliniradius amylolyticus TaxID=2183582 RepID=A0A2S2E536_9ALTE|nr:MotA/TolQ/ExbB proton channel family protein [Saliniradius amylolyticus]AWL12768.1 Biopolymer transport protein ExbB [Saliniradius amylolyticus]
MRTVFKYLVSGLFASVVATGAVAQEQDKALDLDQLLKRLEQGQIAQNQQNERREQEFRQKVAQQDQMLEQARQERNQKLATSEQLERQFQENEYKLGDMNKALSDRMGSLKELFGVLQQVAGDTKSKFQNSVISAQIPGRIEFLEDMAQSMGKSSKMASIEEIERVWFEIQREMTESGKVVKFEADVIEADGEKEREQVVRVGSFALISEDDYLIHNPATGTISELVRQPADRYGDSAERLHESDGELVKFGVDPTGGSILGLLVQAPTLKERIEQGGLVGYIILAVGAIGLLLALERLFTLSIIRAKVKKQLKSDTIKQTNPLGRVLHVRDEFPDADTETLELKLTEAILAEVPRLSRNLTIVKIISVVAPLMGLLGTVTGMILTFQAITLFGTGDPKLMAGGISSALITTVLGLVVAIPMTLLYAILNTRSKNIVHILQEQASGVIAERAERS